MTYRIQLEDLLANAFIEKLKLDNSDRFISYKEIDHYSEEMMKSIHEKGENVELYLSRDNTNNVLKEYCNYFRETVDGIILKSDITIDDLINNFRGYLCLFLMKEYISIYNKIKVKDILNSKPTKEQIFNSVTLDKSYYEKSCKQQIELAKEQEKERNKLKPTNELYNMKFDI